MADLIKIEQCSHCDFGSGQRGMDRCGKCNGIGSVFVVGEQRFPNSQGGYEAALEAEVTRLRAILEGAYDLRSK